MGQAWTVALVWKENHQTLYGGYDVEKAETFFAHDYVYDWEYPDGTRTKGINGYKLMETSYIGNQMVNDVVSELIAHRSGTPRVMWVGEYLKEPDCQDLDQDDEIYRRNKLIGLVNGPFEHSIRHEAVQDAAPPAVWIVCPELGQYVRYDIRESGITALALLCAQGNGLGGGDYFGTNMDLVGTWAFRVLEVRDEKPEEGEDLTDAFKEE